MYSKRTYRSVSEKQTQPEHLYRKVGSSFQMYSNYKHQQYLLETTSLKMPNSTSVLSDRSCASSIITALYWSKSPSFNDSRSNIPSVIYLITVSYVSQNTWARPLESITQSWSPSTCNITLKEGWFRLLQVCLTQNCIKALPQQLNIWKVYIVNYFVPVLWLKILATKVHISPELVYMSHINIVQYYNRHTLDVQSSNRIEYPHAAPNFTPISSLTRLATDMAATRRGWVHPIIPDLPYPSSYKYCIMIEHHFT